MNSFNISGVKISTWKSTGIFNCSDNSNMNAVGNSKGEFPSLINDRRMHVYLNGSHFQKNKATVTNKILINILRITFPNYSE